LIVGYPCISMLRYLVHCWIKKCSTYMVSFVCLLFVVFERKRCKKRIFRAPITFKEWKTAKVGCYWHRFYFIISWRHGRERRQESNLLEPKLAFTWAYKRWHVRSCLVQEIRMIRPSSWLQRSRRHMAHCNKCHRHSITPGPAFDVFFKLEKVDLICFQFFTLLPTHIILYLYWSCLFLISVFVPSPV
jgi:hypothetical protein